MLIRRFYHRDVHKNKKIRKKKKKNTKSVQILRCGSRGCVRAIHPLPLKNATVPGRSDTTVAVLNA